MVDMEGSAYPKSDREQVIKCFIVFMCFIVTELILTYLDHFIKIIFNVIVYLIRCYAVII